LLDAFLDVCAKSAPQLSTVKSPAMQWMDIVSIVWLRLPLLFGDMAV
jgi:hypothetical protein